MYRLDLKVRLHNGSDIAIGPGKAELLAAIAEHGSISAAARALGMSYRRAWLLVETMNRSFKQPLVSTLAGGKHGGGTQLTATGEQVLQRYRGICAAAQVAVQSGCDELAELMAELVPLDHADR
mgnify:FL=1|tara:strand:+ start:859 stop:1230 length:372 start_codon:yes stop_codon:yes gene_type:complete